MAQVVPELIAQHQEILELIHNVLSIDINQRREKIQEVQDNALAALAMICMKIINQFPYPIVGENAFLDQTLTSIPPQVECEEYNDSLEFLGWLFQRYFQGHEAAFISALSRLFADSLDVLINDYGVSPNQIQKMRVLFLQCSQFSGFNQIVSQAVQEDEYKLENIQLALQAQ